MWDLLASTYYGLLIKLFVCIYHRSRGASFIDLHLSLSEVAKTSSGSDGILAFFTFLSLNDHEFF